MDGYGFRYLHRESGHWSVASDFWTWEERIAEHRKANNLPPISIEEAQDQLCGTIPPEQCIYETGDKPPVNTRLGLRDVIDFTKVMLAHAQTQEYVSQEEAERRANICVSCPLNVQVQGCGACGQLASIVAGNRSTKYDSNLRACGVCHCTLKASIHFPLTVMEASSTEEKQAQYPDFCWRKINAENYVAA